jgi:hypothetical protein
MTRCRGALRDDVRRFPGMVAEVEDGEDELIASQLGEDGTVELRRGRSMETTSFEHAASSGRSD